MRIAQLRTVRAALVALAFGVLSCSRGAITNDPSGEPRANCDGGVLPLGSELIAHLPDFELTIRSGGGCLRHYTWDGATRSVYLIPRGEPWYRQTGLYWPGPGYHWRSHGSISRAVISESVIDVESVDVALQWLRNGGSDDRQYGPVEPNVPIRPQGRSFVYRDDGLAVAIGLHPPRRQLNVDVWQITIAGQRPTSMPGSTNEAIKLVVPRQAGRDG